MAAIFGVLHLRMRARSHRKTSAIYLSKRKYYFVFCACMQPDKRIYFFCFCFYLFFFVLFCFLFFCCCCCFFNVLILIMTRRYKVGNNVCCCYCTSGSFAKVEPPFKLIRNESRRKSILICPMRCRSGC